MEFAQRLQQARAIAQLTQAQVASQLHVTRTTISNWENGRSYPDIASLLTLSDLYGLSLDTLIREDQNMQQDLKQQAQERRSAAWTQWAALAVSVGITAIIFAAKHDVAGMQIGTGTRWALTALLALNLGVIGLAATRYRRLRHIATHINPTLLSVGLTMLAISVLGQLINTYHWSEALLALPVLGLGIYFYWHLKHQ